MTHGGPVHQVTDRYALARHLHVPHAQPERRKVSASAIPIGELVNWSPEELAADHRELHEGIRPSAEPLGLEQRGTPLVCRSGGSAEGRQPI